MRTNKGYRGPIFHRKNWKADQDAKSVPYVYDKSLIKMSTCFWCVKEYPILDTYEVSTRLGKRVLFCSKECHKRHLEYHAAVRKHSWKKEIECAMMEGNARVAA